MFRLRALIFLLFGLVTCAPQASEGIRTKYNFNPGWKVLVGDLTGAERPDFNDLSWKNVTAPYAWNEDEAFRLDIANLSTGIAWYRKNFQLPNVTTSNKIFLEFEGIRHGGEFYLNGEWIGRSENGIMAFGFDITHLVLLGKDNVLAARIDSSWDYREKSSNSRYQWNDRNFYANYGGINKNVYLHITDKIYQTLPLYSNLKTTGAYIYARDIDIGKRTAKVTAETQIKNDYTTSKTFSYQVLIEDMDKRTIRTIKGEDHTLGANEKF